MSSCPGHVPALVGETGIQNSVSCTGWGQVGEGTQRRWPGGELPENEVPKLLGKDGQELTKHKAGRKTGRADGMARSKVQRAIWEGEPFHGVTTEVQGGESGTGWGGSQKVEGLPCHTESSQRETPGTLILGRGLRSPKF